MSNEKTLETKENKQRRNRKTKEKGNGEGTIYWSEVLQCYVGQYISKTDYKRKTLKQKKHETKTEFKQRYHDTIAANNNGTLIASNNITLLQILKDYVENKHNNNITSDRTYIRDVETIRALEKHCPNICNKPIQKITVNDIKRTSPELTKYSNNTINKLWRFIKIAFRIAISDRLITYNPIGNIDIKKPKSEKITNPVEALTANEQKKLIDVLSSTTHQYNDALLLQLQTGMRIGEVLALTKDCINMKADTITISKTLSRDKNDKCIMGKTAKTQAGIRTIFMTPQTKELCKKILSYKFTNIENLLFFDYKNNSYISPNEVNCYLHRLNKKYSIAQNLHTHMLRHTFATRFIEAGGSVKVLQKILGHRNIETTLNTYTSVFENFNKDENQKYIEYMQKIGL